MRRMESVENKEIQLPQTADALLHDKYTKFMINLGCDNFQNLSVIS